MTLDAMKIGQEGTIAVWAAQARCGGACWIWA